MSFGRAANSAAAISLYRRCLRSARRCPAFEKREELARYTRLRYEDGRRVRDPATVRHLLSLGEEELLTMNSFHAAREAKEREAAGGGGVVIAEAKEALVSATGFAAAASVPVVAAAPPVKTASASSSRTRKTTPSIPPPPVAVVEVLSIFELLRIASLRLHNVDTVGLGSGSGSRSLRRVADAASHIDRASMILADAQKAAAEALDAASKEIDGLASDDDAAFRKQGVTVFKRHPIPGVASFKSSLDAARAALLSAKAV